MKFIFTLIGLLLVACGSTKKVTVVPNVNKKEVEEGLVASKKVPTSIPGFTYSSKGNVFFRNDVSKNTRKRIVQSILKNNTLDNKAGRLKTKPSPIDLKDPYWVDYYGEKSISGKIKFNIRIGKNGKPDVIIIQEGISKDVDTIASKYISESTFSPGIHAKKGIPVRSWIKLNKTYN